MNERQYIAKLVYHDSVLEVGDLPVDGVLKCIELLHSNLTIIESGVIPYGVERIKFNGFHPDATTKFSNLPTSIHTVENAVVGDNDDSDNDDSDDIDDKINKIPPNITSISFSKFGVLSSSFIKIPNTVKTLNLNKGWNNCGKKIQKGELPEGITNLAMDYRGANNIEEGVLPNSIKHLKVRLYPSSSCREEHEKERIELFKFLPINLESLFISCKYDLSPISNFNRFNSIKKLTIHLYDEKSIEPNSLPQTITDLTIYNVTKPLKKKVIPNSVTYLELLKIFQPISKDIIPNSVKSLVLDRTFHGDGGGICENIFPQSLTSLQIIYDEDCYPYYDDDGCDINELSIININKMIRHCLLLPSLLSITLPKICKDWDIFKFNNFEKILKY